MLRRDLLVIGGAMAAAIALPSVLRRLPSSFEFESLRGFPGFRLLRGGSLSTVNVALIGLDGSPTPSGPTPNLSDDPCVAVFGPDGWTPDQVPVAVFSDFNCPYCKLLDARLLALRAEDASIRLIWHEMPLLGAGSQRAAEAVVAAGFLGAEDAARTYLWDNSLRPGPVALRNMAQALGLDPAAFTAEVGSARVAQTLADSMALGRRLGIPGTPGTLVGRTLVIGAIRPPDLRRLIRMERREGPPDCA